MYYPCWRLCRWPSDCSRSFVFAATLLYSIATSAAGLTITCHIHPPAQDNTAPVTLIGPFATEDQCEQMRVNMFGSGGRCHCLRGFTSPRFGQPPPGDEFMPGETTETPLP